MDSFTPEQLDEIKEVSISFPIFLCKEEEPDMLLQALVITDVGTSNIMGVPETITLEKHLPSGMITQGVYQLVESYKTHISKFPSLPENN